MPLTLAGLNGFAFLNNEHNMRATGAGSHVAVITVRAIVCRLSCVLSMETPRLKSAVFLVCVRKVAVVFRIGLEQACYIPC
jgi:hypothetical protein